MFYYEQELTTKLTNTPNNDEQQHTATHTRFANLPFFFALLFLRS